MNRAVLGLGIAYWAGFASPIGHAQDKPFQASWVWIGGEPSPRNAYAYFRKPLRLSADPTRATIRVTADSRYRLWVNGQLLGGGPSRCDPRTQSYDTYDLSRILHAGTNCIASIVHHVGEGTFSYIQGRAGFLVDGEATLHGGEVIPLHTNESWKALEGLGWRRDLERMDVQLGFPEVFDLRREPQGFTTYDFDDSGWSSAVPIGKPPIEPWTSLVPREIPPLASSWAAPRDLVETGDALDTWPYHVDFFALMRTEHAVAYIATQVESDSDGETVLRLGSDDGLRVFWNGAEVLTHHVHRAARPDQHRVTVALRRGWNTLLVKVEQLVGPWDLYFGFESKAGDAFNPRLAARGAEGGATLDWIGPYPNAERPGAACAGFETAYPPEATSGLAPMEPGADGAASWKPLSLTPGAAGADRDVAVLLATETHRPAAAPRIENAPNLLVADGRVATIRTVPGAGAYAVIDFGREVFGRPVIQITGAKGGILDLGYSEKLDEGRVNPMRENVRYADRMRLRSGPQTIETFDKRAFRYLELVARDLEGPLHVDAVVVREEGYPVSDLSNFECSDSLLNRTFDVCRRTLNLCMEDAYIDCPWRERAQWWGDARVEALTNYVVFGDAALARKGLRQIAQSQRPDGSLLALYPASSIASDFVLPDYVAIWISSLWDYYTYTADAAPLRELLPAVERALEWFRTLEGPEGLLRDVKGWVFIDWADIDKRGEIAPLNGFYLAALEDAERIAGIAGRADRASEWRARAARVRDAFARRLYSPDAKRFVDCRVGDVLSERTSLHANVFPVLLDIGSEEARRGALEHLLTTLEKDPTGQASPYFDHYLLAALFKEERHREGLAQIRRAWKFMLDRGATTCWERFSEDGSLCHAWSASPAFYLLTEILGIKPGRPGFEEIVIHPNTVDLYQARGTLVSPKGYVSVAWRVTGGRGFEMNVKTREPVPTILDVPLHPGAETVLLEQDVIWKASGGAAAAAPGLIAVDHLGERLRLVVSGRANYHVVVQ